MKKQAAEKVTVQYFLILKPRIHKTVSRKRFLSEYERAVDSRFEVRGSRFETMQCLFIRKVNTARQTINRKRFPGEHERTVDSRFEVRGSRFETMQRLLVPVAQARKVINRKRLLEEYERTVDSM
ncbi:MAG: hypothetical protein FWC60_04005, partial [Firmicutes bacterium]|nr:hypothetical protein [Bacillota bacterium]